MIAAPRPAPAFLAACAREVERELRRRAPWAAAGAPGAGGAGAAASESPGCPERLAAAIELALFGGGKRVRPAIVLGAWEAAGGAPGTRPAALSAACAVECVHAYSLVHDDLPAMDDAELRHGRPAVHRAYGEATAVLAGDALQALAFEVLAAAPWPDPAAGLAAVRALAEACGARGLVGGQEDDLHARGADAAALLSLYGRKTGALFRASARLGGLAAGAGPEALAALEAFADAFGLAYQAVDDALDVTGLPGETGKDARRDEELGRPTLASLLGVEGALALARRKAEEAAGALRPFGARGRHLRQLAAWAVARSS
ncbi:MAG: polyprenyl synthetase family protein [Clostridia bacterium]|nr:polyprenyl synthetase family protein [Clostridia bacterium]